MDIYIAYVYKYIAYNEHCVQLVEPKSACRYRHFLQSRLLSAIKYFERAQIYQHGHMLNWFGDKSPLSRIWLLLLTV